MKTSLLIGRWQPLHLGHKVLIDTLLLDGSRVVIGIRDTKPSEANPLSIYERRRALQAVYGNQIETIVIPDPDCDLEIVHGRKVGWGIRQIELPKEIEEISATALRERKVIVWLTGNSGAGKTTLANRLRSKLRAVVLDGNEMRESISLGADFSFDDRLEHNLRVARLAKVLQRQCNVIVAVIAPFNEIRDEIEKIISPIWIYMARPSLPEREDYPYEEPESPHITVNSDEMSPDEEAEIVMKCLNI